MSTTKDFWNSKHLLMESFCGMQFQKEHASFGPRQFHIRMFDNSPDIDLEVISLHDKTAPHLGKVPVNMQIHGHLIAHLIDRRTQSISLLGSVSLEQPALWLQQALIIWLRRVTSNICSHTVCRGDTQIEYIKCHTKNCNKTNSKIHYIYILLFKVDIQF